MKKGELTAIPSHVLQEVSGCTCLRIRKTTRLLTRIYDEALVSSGLTVTQFGILASLAGLGALSIGNLAEHMGMDPTSLNRTLMPLQRKRLVRAKQCPDDRRIRRIEICAPGETLLAAAIPNWKRAQQHVHASMGSTVRDLNECLDLAFSKIS